MNKKYYLYYLIDPELQVPKYIGITCNPKNRLQKHLEDTAITKKTTWIKALKVKNLIPIMEIKKETTNVREVISWEIEEIQTHLEEWDLTNSTPGGEYYAIGRPIDVYTLEGKFVESCDSMLEFCEKHKKRKTFGCSIKDSCMKYKSYADQWIFRYAGDPLTDYDIQRAQHSYKYHNPGKFIIVDIRSKQILGEFNQLIDAEKANYGSANRIGECLANKAKAHSLNNKYFALHNIDEYDTRLHIYLCGLQHNDIGKWIIKYDLSGNYIDKFATISEAARSCNAPSLNSIKACLHGNQRKAYGYLWKYGLTFDTIEPYGTRTYNGKNRSKKVLQYDLNNNLLRVFDTIKDAAEAVHGKNNGISCCARGVQKTAYGYIWKYENAVQQSDLLYNNP